MAESFGSIQKIRHDGGMQTIKRFWRRMDAFTLETYNPPHVRWHNKQR